MSELTKRLPGNWSRTSTQAIAVPKTTLIDDDDQRRDQRQLQRRDRLRRGDRVPERAEPPSSDVATTAAIGSSTITLR